MPQITASIMFRRTTPANMSLIFPNFALYLGCRTSISFSRDVFINSDIITKKDNISMIRNSVLGIFRSMEIMITNIPMSAWIFMFLSFEKPCTIPFRAR